MFRLQISDPRDLGSGRNRGCAHDHRTAKYGLVYFDFTRAVRADEIGDGTCVLSESHIGKILNFAPGLPLSIVYFRIAARGPILRTRARVLERMLARGDAGGRVADWRLDAFRAIAPQSPALPAVASAALRRVAGAKHGAWACIATPVHLVAGMNSVSLPWDGVLAIAAAQADALAADFNRRFTGGGVQLLRGEDSLLVCLFDARTEFEAADPDQLPPGDIWGALPSGVDSGQVRRLMSEVEMWLFEHPINEARVAQGLQPVSGLWLWGGGPAGLSVPEVQGWTAGRDPMFAAFDRQRQYPAGRPCGVVVLADWPGTPQWQAAEEQWISPAFADLKSGVLERIELSVGARRFGWTVASLRRFWRKSRPWWDVMGLGDA